jgi:phosphatidylinositol-3-phosphatase
MRRLTLGLALAAALALALPAASSAALPPIKHVFVIVLENENADATFGANSKAPYLARTLPTQGQFVPNYYGVTHLSLGNYVAMVSGQGSNPQTQADCNVYSEFAPGLVGADQQAMGQGCVYPPQVRTIADQLDQEGKTWKGYMEDMKTPCRHPAIGSQDTTQQAKPGDQYAARHNPFVYFHSIIDHPRCAQNDVPLERMPADLRSAATTANYVFITPNLCHDGHDEPCVDHQPGGLVSADAFLKTWIPQIQASAGYREGGLIVVTFDEAESGPGGGADSSACCNQPQFPNTPNNGGPTAGPGGGRTGAVLLSPFIKPGTTNQTAYNHFSLLRSVEDMFGLLHLGYADQNGLQPFGADVFNAGPPALSRLAVKPAKRRSPKRTVSYSVSQPAQVSFSIDRGVLGRRSRGRCRKPTRRNRRARTCRRYKRVRGSFAQSAITGSNSLGFGGRLNGRRLKAGHYRLIAVADGFAGRSNRATRYFRVTAAKKKKRRHHTRRRARTRAIHLAG